MCGGQERCQRAAAATVNRPVPSPNPLASSTACITFGLPDRLWSPWYSVVHHKTHSLTYSPHSSNTTHTHSLHIRQTNTRSKSAKRILSRTLLSTMSSIVGALPKNLSRARLRSQIPRSLPAHIWWSLWCVFFCCCHCLSFWQEFDVHIHVWLWPEWDAPFQDSRTPTAPHTKRSASFEIVDMATKRPHIPRISRDHISPPLAHPMSFYFFCLLFIPRHDDHYLGLPSVCLLATSSRSHFEVVLIRSGALSVGVCCLFTHCSRRHLICVIIQCATNVDAVNWVESICLSDVLRLVTAQRFLVSV